jgi:hypothetical protein
VNRRRAREAHRLAGELAGLGLTPPAKARRLRGWLAAVDAATRPGATRRPRADITGRQRPAHPPAGAGELAPRSHPGVASLGPRQAGRARPGILAVHRELGRVEGRKVVRR